MAPDRTPAPDNPRALTALPAEERQRRGDLVQRAWPILLIPPLIALTTVFSVRLLGGGSVGERPAFAPAAPIMGVTLLGFLGAVIILARLGRPTISALLLIGCWTFLTSVTWLSFGVTSFFPALLVLPICAAGLLIDRIATVSLAVIAITLVALVAWLEANGILPLRGAQGDPVVAAMGSYGQVIAASFWAGLFIAVAWLTALLAGGLQQALAQSRAQAAHLQGLSEQLEQRVAEQTEQLLEQERAAATLEERTRLAREIHDTLAQGLSGIAVQIGAAERALRVAPEGASQHLELAGTMTREALAEARRSVWNLRAHALARGDLADALQRVAELTTWQGLPVTFTCTGTAAALEPAVESTLLRVAQEALANALKHSGATAAELVLTFRPEAVQLVVRDNGQGFQAEELERRFAPGPWGGFGLLGMGERVAALGGQLTLENRDGAVVQAEVPLERASS